MTSQTCPAVIPPPHRVGGSLIGRPLRVDERARCPVISWFGGMAAAVQKGDADRKHTVSNSPGVCPRAREQEEEELQVRQQEDQCPHPQRKWWHMDSDSGRWSWWACTCSLHTFQTEAVDLKDVVSHHDAEQQVESYTHPSHPLTEVHHPPYCRRNRLKINTGST